MDVLEEEFLLFTNIVAVSFIARSPTQPRQQSDSSRIWNKSVCNEIYYERAMAAEN